MVAAGALGFAACALYAGTRAYEAHELRVRAAELALEGRNAAQRYQRITASFPVTETTTENLRVAVLEFRRLAEASAQPDLGLIHVSRVLERFPQMELDAVQWSVGRPGERQVEARTPGAGARAATRQIALSGRVNATQRDYRGITAQVPALASALASNGYQLLRTTPVRRNLRRHADRRHGRDSSEAPRFTIILARSPP